LGAKDPISKRLSIAMEEKFKATFTHTTGAPAVYTLATWSTYGGGSTSIAQSTSSIEFPSWSIVGEPTYGYRTRRGIPGTVTCTWMGVYATGTW